MKRVGKSFPAPQTLRDYAQTGHDATWKQMYDDNAQGGYQAVRDCRAQAVRDQHGLCAYCEQKITMEDPLRCRVEHFHSKSDSAGTHNWGLDWKNMLAVCDGGSRSSQEAQKTHPLPANLSCDAHKNHIVQTGKLPAACEGQLLNPLEMPAFPNLFTLDKGTGRFRPDKTACAAVEIPGNACGTTEALVNSTIAALNLNCARLTEKRRLLAANIEYNKKILRERGMLPAEMPEKLVRRYFSIQWPEFFTTLRCCLGPFAEDYLQSVQYQG